MLLCCKKGGFTKTRTKQLCPGEIIPLTFDYIFTAIFNNPNNVDIIEEILSSYLEIPLKNMEGKLKI